MPGGPSGDYRPPFRNRPGQPAGDYPSAGAAGWNAADPPPGTGPDSAYGAVPTSGPSSTDPGYAAPTSGAASGPRAGPVYGVAMSGAGPASGAGPPFGIAPPSADPTAPARATYGSETPLDATAAAGPPFAGTAPPDLSHPSGATPDSDTGRPYRGSPTSGAGQPYGGTPTSGAGQPYGGIPTSGAGQPYGGIPTSGAGQPYGGIPTSGAGQPYGTNPTSGAGQPYGTVPTPPSWSATDPISGGAPTPDPYGLSVTPAYAAGPRIEPTPKQPKSRLLLPALAGLLAGLVIFGTGGWFLGRSTAGGPDPAPIGTQAAPTGSPATLAPYEQNQVTINQPKFTGPLAPVAQGWLAQLSGCTRTGEKGGPVLNKGEKTRVRCEMDAMSVIFVEYATAADRDKARVKTLGQNVDARTLTPGAGPAVVRASPSGRTNGNYVEYAYQASGRTVSGIWWDDSTAPVAAYLLAYWKEGVGQKWEPMRDVWARYA